MYWNLKDNILDQFRIQGEGQGWLVTPCKRIEKSCAPFSFLGYEFSNSNVMLNTKSECFHKVYTRNVSAKQSDPSAQVVLSIWVSEYASRAHVP